MTESAEICEEPSALYTFREELAHSITHGVGLFLSIGGLVVMVAFAAMSRDVYRIVSVSIFGSTLILAYAASTMYHSVRGPAAKKVWRVLDHTSIYLLIAGSYTPFMLVTIRGTVGWTIFGVLWGITVMGILMKIFYMGRFAVFSVFLYLGMGWLGIFAARPVMEGLGLWGTGWLAAGGLAYTIGVIFYAWERLPFNHAIWHLFVLTGSICHFFSVLFFVVLVD